MTLPACPECTSEFTYELPPMIVCPECAHEWNPSTDSHDEATTPSNSVIKDSVGNELADGDSITITQTVKVKGAQQALKSGTKVRNIRLNFDAGTGLEDHNIDCKIDGFGAMTLKPAVVKKS
ncbi:zinc ribbon domain-containing protein YjdM [Corynebacterium propinquum]|uniref:Zinc ribbon domain-containing protein YjdM n=1 Tax=Corynebacterium propinquum TaxID=43769 RepID=A0AAP4FAN8_9CORY|nr:zinc ribbon domain-containing protein YjdM [Corynebacterium propinquum]MCG7232340.1 alkylphosphonate utilization protein [Corynebacterium propinquum]MCT1817401.1 zinc ribbon domain-containing protein YjdM [Corynebacterium propinquum]MDK4238884.1 zinc ribbon domain-containing protein YjdM [Corynebacterium propinquum]MDK4251185.1 zinc ribbon domain-containing protein YjdM [Corynebacterium propinquum]MDK4257093.1 zinc ribbon domain-containing protein YjdM [Corynebacterium propinquum]